MESMDQGRTIVKDSRGFLSKPRATRHSIVGDVWCLYLEMLRILLFIEFWLFVCLRSFRLIAWPGHLKQRLSQPKHSVLLSLLSVPSRGTDLGRRILGFGLWLSWSRSVCDVCFAEVCSATPPSRALRQTRCLGYPERPEHRPHRLREATALSPKPL